MNSSQILDREYLEIRAKILEVAASLDRIDRSEGDVSDDGRMQLIADAIELIASQHSDSDRARQIQLLFSREYDSKWQASYGITTRV